MSATATAAVSRAAAAPFAIEEVEIEAPRAGEVLVEIAAAGFCHTDLTVNGGSFPTPFPVVLGHEGAGVVAAVGEGVTHVVAGDRVALSYDSCGSCPSCLVGRPYHCHAFFAHNFMASRGDGSTGISSHGEAVHSHFFGQSSFSSVAVVSARSVVVLPPDIPFELAAPLGCGIQTGTGTVLNALAPPAGSSLAVFGVGGVGLSAVMAARIVGASPIIAIDLSPARLELARELGATDTIDPGQEDVVEAIMRITGTGVDYAVEASGATVALRAAVDATGPGGTVALVGAPPGGVEVSLDVNMVLAKGRSIRAIVEGHSVPGVFIPRLVSFWRAGLLPLERLVRTFPLSAINEAAASAQRGDTIKPVLIPGS